jgi:hypothetical protein
MKLSKSLTLAFLATVCLFNYSCTQVGSSKPELAQEELLGSMIDSWMISSEINFQTLKVHDFSTSGELGNFINRDAVFFVFPGNTCTSCLEREFQKFLDWELLIDKYILGVDLNSNYLLSLINQNPEIRKGFIVDISPEIKKSILLPCIIFRRPNLDTSITYSAVKSESIHFEYFKSVVESIINKNNESNR